MPIFPVIGAKRSGTSLTAGVLHLCAVPMFLPGKAIYDNAGDEWNRGGHFADADFEDLIGPRLPELSMPEPTWTPDPAALAKIEELIAARAHLPRWGFKGKHAWIGAATLAALGHDVRILNTSRPLAQSQASYEARIGELYKAEAAAHVAACKQQSDQFFAAFTGPKLLVDFDETLADPAAAVGRIAAFAGVQPTQAAIDFVNVEWRRFN